MTSIDLINGKLVRFPNGVPGIPGSVKDGFCWLLLGTTNVYKIMGELHPLDYEEYCYYSHPDNEHVLDTQSGNYLVVQSYKAPHSLSESYSPDRFSDAHHSEGGLL